jgi:predicted transcriptional regulator
MRSFRNASRVLGELEEAVMDVLWDEAPLTVRDVSQRVARRKLAYTTVMTTLDRLYKKRLLAREKVGLAFEYRPAIDRDEYHRRVVEAAVTPLFEDGAKSVLAAFVDVAADIDREHLEQLQRLIAERRKRR